jgi:hypothetical protein
MAKWSNPIPAVQPAEPPILRQIFTSIEKWSDGVGTGATGPAGPQGPQGIQGRFIVSDTAPSSPIVGDIWFNSLSAVSYAFYDSHWIELGSGSQGPQGPQGPFGGTLNVDGGDPNSIYGGILPLDAGGI